jgi:hypothetical protein
MKTNTKIGLIIGGVVLAGLGVSAYLYFRSKPKTNDYDKDISTEDIVLAPTTNQGSNSSEPTKCEHPETPFKNTDKGNTFRAWINKNEPDYAKKIDLDPKGAFNNCYIRRAWKDYGNSYSFFQNTIMSGLSDFFTA